MDLPHPTAILKKVTGTLDALIIAAEPYHGLFPSILDRRTGKMLNKLPPPIPGQRNGDRSFLGSNLIHDEATLKTLYALSQALNKPEYTEAADTYLQRFATHCTDTATGLFPWGEHCYWHLSEDRIGDSYVDHSGGQPPRDAIHDHLRQAPRWLWDRLWEHNSHCVQRFAEGLHYHWVDGKREQYIRHANVTKRAYPKHGARSCDFPRHGGFYIFDWAYAWDKTARTDFLEQIETMLDYWWVKRDHRGMLLIESRCPPGIKPDFHDINAPAQTLSLAASLLETAPIITAKNPVLAATMRERAAVYLDGFFAAPHDLEDSVYVILSRRNDNAVTQTMPIWGSKYGVWPASYVALTCLCAYRLTNDPRLLGWAQAVGRGYVAERFPGDEQVPAMDAGLGLGLLADLYNITGDQAWIEGALNLADNLLSVYFDKAPLPRGAAGIDWYESQMGPGFLLHGLARTALLAEAPESTPLSADYTTR